MQVPLKLWFRDAHIRCLLTIPGGSFLKTCKNSQEPKPSLHDSLLKCQLGRICFIYMGQFWMYIKIKSPVLTSFPFLLLLKQCFSKFRVSGNPLASCQKVDSDSVGLGWTSRLCISHKRPDDASAVGLWIRFWVAGYSREKKKVLGGWSLVSVLTCTLGGGVSSGNTMP